MSFDDEGELDAFVYRDSYLPHVTAESVAEALERFPLSLATVRSWDWLAMAVRRSMAMTMQNVTEGPNRQSNADTRKELQALARRAGKLWAALFEGRSAEAEDAIWSYSWRRWDGSGGEDIGNGLTIGDPTDWRRFEDAVRELDWVSVFLHKVAQQVPSQAPKWTKAEWRELRIQRGQYLLPIYLAAFLANELTNKTFGDFYQRMVSLAFPDEMDDIPDFEALISEARKRHETSPVAFNPRHIPGLSP